MLIPMRARAAFASQMKQSGDSDYLFPSPRMGSSKPHITTVHTLWNRTLQRAGLPHFSLYELRHTFATRLSTGGGADHFVTQMLRQGDAAVFKRYSQAKLNMMREALSKLDREANERGATSFTALAGMGWTSNGSGSNLKGGTIPGGRSVHMLPDWPLKPGDPGPGIVVGELHHPVAIRQISNPSWLTIPERGLYTGVAIFGAVGSGKTSACMHPLAKQAGVFHGFPPTPSSRFSYTTSGRLLSLATPTA